MNRTINGGTWAQESYATGDPQIKLRAHQLRTLGYDVRCTVMGRQVTDLGVMRMTLLSIRPGRNLDTAGLPAGLPAMEG